MRASVVLLAVEVGLGVAFMVLLGGEWYRVGGVVEWVMAGFFTFYFWAFWGFLVEGGGEVGERRALLG